MQSMKLNGLEWTSDVIAPAVCVFSVNFLQKNFFFFLSRVIIALERISMTLFKRHPKP